MQQHPQSNIEEINNFADRMKNLGVKRYLKVRKTLLSKNNFNAIFNIENMFYYENSH